MNYSRWLKTENLFFIFTFIFLNVLSAIAGPNRTTYQAKIVKPDGYPLEASAVNFKFTILDPAGACILYSETYSSVNMASTGGLISFALGSGVKTYPVSATTFENVFSNITPNLSCDVGGPPSYSPAADDTRKIVMQFHDGSGWQTLPAMAINAVPYAMFANDSQKLNGKAASDFVEVSTLPMTCGVSEALRFNGAAFSCIAVGDASAAVTSGSVISALGYTPADGANVSAVSSTLSTTNATVAAVSSSVFSVSSTVTSLANTVAASFAAITSSQWTTSGTGIFYNSGNVGIGTDSPTNKLMVVNSGTTPFYAFNTSSNFGAIIRGRNNANTIGNHAGLLIQNDAAEGGAAGRVAGIAMGNSISNNIGFIGTKITDATSGYGDLMFATRGTAGYAERMRINSNGDVGIGTATPVTKLDIAGGIRIGAEASTCDASFAGTLRYNAGVVEYCNGTSWVTFGVSGAGILAINGLVSGSQTFAFGSTGNSPSVSSVGSVHTFNFPFASVGTTTAGVISYADYLLFSSKVNATSAAVISALGYTPANAVSVTTLSSTVNSVSSTVSSLSNAMAASFASVVNSQWITSATSIYYSAGNVGIGTLSPSYMLDVSSTTRLSSSTSGGVRIGNGQLRIDSNSDAGSALTYMGTQLNIGESNSRSYNTASNAALINAWSSADGKKILSLKTNTTNGYVDMTQASVDTFNLSFVQNGVAQMYLKSDGNVGIATSSPQSVLSIGSNIGTGYALTANSTSAYGAIVQTADAAATANAAFWVRTTPDSGATVNTLLRVQNNGRVGLGVSSPTARLHLAAGTTAAATAPLKFSSGTLMTTPEAGAVEYDGSGFYLTDGAGTRRVIATATNPGSLDNASIINSTGNMNLVPVGSVIVSSTVASTNSQTGALIVNGGLGVAGNINSSGTIMTSSNMQGASVTATNGMITPYIYGSISSGGSLSLESTTHATKGSLNLNTHGGNVGIGTNTPLDNLHINSNTGDATLRITADPANVNEQSVPGILMQGDGALTNLFIGMTAQTPQYAGVPENAMVLAATTGTPSSGSGVYFVTGTNVSNTVKLAITESGNVGIGNTSPAGKFMVTHDPGVVGVGSATATFDAPGNTATDYALYLRAKSGAGTVSNVMVVRGDGRVGIGNGNPQSTLMVSGDVSNTTFYGASSDARLNIDLPASSYASIEASNKSGSLNRHLSLQTNGGYVGVGTSIPISAMHVAGDVRVGAIAPAAVSDTAGPGNRLYFSGGPAQAGRDSDNSDVMYMQRYNYSNDSSELQMSLGDNGSDPFTMGYTSGGYVPTFKFNAQGYLAIGTGFNPTARLHLASGTAAGNSAPLKFTSGTLMTTAQAGAVEYNGFDLYFTDGAGVRRALATGSTPSTIDDANNINATGDITMTPTGSVIVSSTVASTNSTTGALIVKGGLGVAGNINSSGTIITSSDIQGASITATNAMITPYVYGSTVASGALRLESTTNATKGNILMNVTGGNVGIGTLNPAQGKLQVQQTTDASSGGITVFNAAGSTGARLWVDGNTGAIDVNTGGTGNLIINRGGGHVGIGTTSANGVLHVADATAADIRLENTGAVSSALRLLSQNGYNYIQSGASFGASSTADLRFTNMMGATTWMTLQASTGNLGIGTTAPTAKLNLAAGAATLAPLKLTSGTLLSTAQAGSIEYDGFDFYITDGNNIRRTIATATSAGTLDSVTVVSSPSGIALWPAAGNSVTVSATTASTNSTTGALIVKGGLGVAGNINSSGTIITSSNIQGVSITATNSMVTPYVYGSTVSGGALRLESTTNATKGYILMNATGGNVGIGTAAPEATLNVNGALQVGLQSGYYTTLGSNSLGFNRTAASGTFSYLDQRGVGGAFMFRTTQATSLDTNAMTLTASGNLGIGTITPTTLVNMSGSTDGDAELLIEADTDDNGEGDNPFIHFKQDGNLTHGYIGLSGNPNEAFNLTVNDVSTNSLVMNSASSPIFLATSNTARLSIATSGNVGISINNALAKLHIASGTAAANTAPIKLTSGTLMSAAQAGSIEYDGFDFYITDGNNIRRTIATATSAGTLDSVTVVSSPSGIALWPAAGNSVTVSATTASTNSTTGALIVKGGLGVAGNINSSGTIITSSNIQGVSITATNSMISPYIYGSIVSGGSLRIDSTTHASKGSVLLAPLSGSVGIRTSNPSGIFDIGGGEGSDEKRLVFSASDYSDRFYVETDLEASTNSDKLGFRSLTTDNVLVMTGAGKVGVGTASPQLQLTVDDTAGTVSSPYATATDKLAVMSTGNAVIQVTTPNTQSGAIYFSDPESRDPGGVAYSHLSDSMVFRANGATRMTITASGNVGVGTGSPAANLHVFAADTTIAELEVTGSAQGSGVIYVGQSSTFGAGMLYNGDDAPDQLGTSDDVVFFRRDAGVDYEVFKYRYNSNNVTFTGNIGIGTSVPAQRLSVDGDVSITGDLKMTGSDSYIWTNGTGTGYTGIWDTANSRTLLFASESSGNIGIGSAAPTQILDVIKTTGDANIRMKTNAGDSDAGLILQNDARTWKINTKAGYADALTFEDVNSSLPAMVIKHTTGNVGIGTTNPTYKLDVSGGARVLASNGSNFWSERVDSEYDIQQAAGSTKRGFSIHPSTTGGDVVNFYGNNAGSYVLGLTVKNVTGRVGVLNSNPGYPLAVGGDVSIAAGSNLRFDATIVCTSAGCTASSDKRLKENIQPMDFSLEKLLSLNAVQYDWKDKAKFGAQHEIGLIAQDLEKVYPEVVHTDKDSGFKSVSYDKLVAPIIEALKVFNKRIAQLFDRTEKNAREIASVKEENAELKARVEKTEKENADLKKRLERIEKALAN